MVSHNGHENARSDWSIPHLLFPKWVYNGEASARLNYDCARKSAQFDQWPSGKLYTGSRVQSFPCAFPSSTDVPVLLLDHSKTCQLKRNYTSCLMTKLPKVYADIKGN